MAGEWACSDGRDGLVRCYEADLDGLSVLRLNATGNGTLTWLAVLARHRIFWQRCSVSEEDRDYLLRHFPADPSPYDVIIGCHADGYRFTLTQDFLSGTVPLSVLTAAAGSGEQTVFRSPCALARIRFARAEPAGAAVCYPRKVARDLELLRRSRRDARIQGRVRCS